MSHVLFHARTEPACHGGHLDAAREPLDGRTWLGGSPYAGDRPRRTHPRVP